MAQQEIINILEKANKPLSRTEIAQELKMDKILISHSIMRLIKGREIKVMEIDRHQAQEFYKCKRRMRLYYI